MNKLQSPVHGVLSQSPTSSLSCFGTDGSGSALPLPGERGYKASNIQSAVRDPSCCPQPW